MLLAGAIAIEYSCYVERKGKKLQIGLSAPIAYGIDRRSG
jgi:hypothetical protein